MDSKELRGLMEAYSEVYAPKEIDEAVKGADPEMRRAASAERRAGDKRLSPSKAKGYAAHAMQQAAYVDKKTKGKHIPGYAYAEEVEQIDEISQKTATSAYAQRRTGEFEGDDASDRVAKTNKLKGRIEKKFGKEAGKHADRAADVQTFGRKDASGRRKQSPQPRIQTSDHENQREFKRELRIRRDRRLRAARGEDTNEQFDIFDVVLEFLQTEGYAETLEEAEWLMANVINEEAIGIILGEEQLDELSVGKMLAYGKAAQKDRGVLNKKWDEKKASHKEKMRVLGHEEGEERAAQKIKKKTGKYPHQMNALDKARYSVTKEDYVDEAQHARENPEKYEREQSKKYAPVRGERTPMPPRGDKRREDFEKWYAKQMGR